MMKKNSTEAMSEPAQRQTAGRATITAEDRYSHPAHLASEHYWRAVPAAISTGWWVVSTASPPRLQMRADQSGDETTAAASSATKGSSSSHSLAPFVDQPASATRRFCPATGSGRQILAPGEPQQFEGVRVCPSSSGVVGQPPRSSGFPAASFFP